MERGPARVPRLGALVGFADRLPGMAFVIDQVGLLGYLASYAGCAAPPRARSWAASQRRPPTISARRFPMEPESRSTSHSGSPDTTSWPLLSEPHGRVLGPAAAVILRTNGCEEDMKIVSRLTSESQLTCLTHDYFALKRLLTRWRLPIPRQLA